MLATGSRQLADLSQTCKTARGCSKRREIEWNRFIGGQGGGFVYVSEKFASVEEGGSEAVARASLEMEGKIDTAEEGRIS